LGATLGQLRPATNPINRWRDQIANAAIIDRHIDRRSSIIDRQ
jgi:hypothetical protein